MCGIYGFAGRKINASREERAQVLSRMGNLVKHRGPDDEGMFVSEYVGMGIKRLSIIDIELGRQPIWNEDNSVAVCCNGEVYNYVELRSELLKRGHRFRTNSDTEVLVHLYEESGEDFLNGVNGMFGLALWDKAKKKLVLARDRIGIKPLYYFWDGEKVIFGSELKSVLAFPGIKREIDQDALILYFRRMYIPAPETIFSGIKKLEAGTMLIHNNSQLAKKKYWDLAGKASNRKYDNMEDAAEEIKALIKDAVKLQLRSDVPVGSFLSGGIDSSAVTAFASMQSPYKMNTYNVHWGDIREKTDERPYARELAKAYGVNHHEYLVTEKDFSGLAEKLIWHLEEPFGDAAFLPTYIISREAARDLKVVLNGSGGDELFGGYNHFCTNRLVDILRYAKKSLYGARGPSFLNIKSGNPERLDIERSTRERFRSLDYLNLKMAMDLNIYLQDNVLFLLDKITMATSLEGRVPLLDHRIVEIAASLPSSWKIKGKGKKKIVFRKAMEGVLPASILNRSKEGFGVPMTSWMNRGLKNTAADYIKGGNLTRSGIISKKYITGIDKKKKLTRRESWDLWLIYILELWHRKIYQHNWHESAS